MKPTGEQSTDDRPLRSLLLGLAVGDALGVPYEFGPRPARRQDPCTDMVGYRTHNQPPGTWSDDTSMALVLTEQLSAAAPLEAVASGFARWLFEAEWTPGGEVFDYGGATANALADFAQGGNPRTSGGTGEASNGNGSLMRTAPLAWFVRELPPEQRRIRSFEISAITHAHPRSLLACWFCVEVCVALLAGKAPAGAVDESWDEIAFWVESNPDFALDWKYYARCRSSLARRPVQEISSSGYVVHTLEAALWCLLTSSNYRETVLRAVNLGEDTDTTGAVAGAFSGLVYGEAQIPKEWLAALARRDDIVRLSTLAGEGGRRRGGGTG